MYIGISIFINIPGFLLYASYNLQYFTGVESMRILNCKKLDKVCNKLTEIYVLPSATSYAGGEHPQERVITYVDGETMG